MSTFNIPQQKFIRALKRIAHFIIPNFAYESKVWNISKSWLFQGALYLIPSELCYRIVIELVIISLLTMTISIFCSISVAAIIGIFLSHTAMWLFNGHVWALQRYGTNNTPDDVRKYLNDLQQRMVRYKSITGCVILGSMARGEFGRKSDIDIGCIRNKGFISAVCAYSQGMFERSIAFLSRKPIELWFNNLTNFQLLLDVEKPLIIKDSNGEVAKIMPTAIPLSRYPFDNDFWKSIEGDKELSKNPSIVLKSINFKE